MHLKLSNKPGGSASVAESHLSTGSRKSKPFAAVPSFWFRICRRLSLQLVTRLNKIYYFCLLWEARTSRRPSSISRLQRIRITMCSLGSLTAVAAGADVALTGGPQGQHNVARIVAAITMTVITHLWWSTGCICVYVQAAPDSFLCSGVDITLLLPSQLLRHTWCHTSAQVTRHLVLSSLLGILDAAICRAGDFILLLSCPRRHMKVNLDLRQECHHHIPLFHRNP